MSETDAAPPTTDVPAEGAPPADAPADAEPPAPTHTPKEFKVIYFNVKALAEPLRFLLAYGAIDFDDVRIAREEWPALKPSKFKEQIKKKKKLKTRSLSVKHFLAEFYCFVYRMRETKFVFA